MFCPKCRGEFREGFTHCEKCGEDLVDDLPYQSESMETEPSPVAEAVKDVFHIEIWLKRGALVYIIIGILSDITSFYAKTQMSSPYGMFQSGRIWKIVYAADFASTMAGTLLWGAFFYALGVIIDILKQGFSNAKA